MKINDETISAEDKRKEAIKIVNAYRLERAQYFAKLDSKESLLEHLAEAAINAEKVQIDAEFAIHFLAKKHNHSVKLSSAVGWKAPEKGTKYTVKEKADKPKKAPSKMSMRGKSDKEKAVIKLAQFFMKMQGKTEAEALEIANKQVNSMMEKK